MPNRILHYLEDPLEPRRTDYWYVRGEFGFCIVTPAVARRIAAVCERLILPRWIVFRDISGSEIRIRPRQLRSLVEATAEQRAADRAFERPGRRRTRPTAGPGRTTERIPSSTACRKPKNRKPKNSS